MDMIAKLPCNVQFRGRDAQNIPAKVNPTKKNIAYFISSIYF